jgi:hypothetical protein
MIVWSQILLLLIIPVSIYLYQARMGNNRRDAKVIGLMVLIAALIFEITRHIEFTYKEMSQEYLIISIFIMILILILMSIRRLRPEISRYPYPFVYVPVLILLFYPLIQGTNALTDIILMIIQGGAVVAAVFLTAAHFDLFKKRWVAILNVLLLMSTYIIFWYLPAFIEIRIWMWQSLLAAGMITAAISLPVILSETNFYKPPQEL